MWSTGRNTDEKFSWQVNPGGKPRSLSFSAGDSNTTPPSHRRHRMQFLANRSLFEPSAPPTPLSSSRPTPTRQESFTYFADELLNKREVSVDCSLPPLKIVEEPICKRKYVYNTSSIIVDNIDSQQPEVLNNDTKMEEMGRDKKVGINRSTSDAIKYSSYKPRNEYQPSWQVKPGGKPRSLSFGAGDSITTPPTHRSHRMQFLANRSRFEPTAPPPSLQSSSRPTPTRQESFTYFAEELLNKREIPVNCSLPPLKIVEEPICIRKHVYYTSSSIVDNIDLWQPAWLNNDTKMDEIGRDKKVGVNRSNSDAIKNSSYKPRDECKSKMGQQYLAASKYPMAKTVRNLADAYQTAAAEKSKPPMLARRSSMSAMPVKAMARRYSIPNE